MLQVIVKPKKTNSELRMLEKTGFKRTGPTCHSARDTRTVLRQISDGHVIWNNWESTDREGHPFQPRLFSLGHFLEDVFVDMTKTLADLKKHHGGNGANRCSNAGEADGQLEFRCSFLRCSQHRVLDWQSSTRQKTKLPFIHLRFGARVS